RRRASDRGVPALPIADLSTVWVQADVFEPDLPLVRNLAGKPIPFRLNDAPLAPHKATVLDPGQMFDKSSRAVALIAVAQNRDRSLKPGQFVEVGLPRGTGDKPVLQVPLSAIQRHEDRTFVFVQTGDDEFAAKTVSLGRVADDRVEIRGGIRPGKRVVVA